VIPPEAEDFVGPTASKPSEQSKLKRLKYGSLLELVAERYHSAERISKKAESGHEPGETHAGSTVKVPNVLPFKIEDMHEGFVPANPAFRQPQDLMSTEGADSS